MQEQVLAEMKARQLQFEESQLDMESEANEGASPDPELHASSCRPLVCKHSGMVSSGSLAGTAPLAPACLVVMLVLRAPPSEALRNVLSTDVHVGGLKGHARGCDRHRPLKHIPIKTQFDATRRLTKGVGVNSFSWLSSLPLWCGRGRGGAGVC